MCDLSCNISDCDYDSGDCLGKDAMKSSSAFAAWHAGGESSAMEPCKPGKFGRGAEWRVRLGKRGTATVTCSVFQLHAYI